MKFFLEVQWGGWFTVWAIDAEGCKTLLASDENLSQALKTAQREAASRYGIDINTEFMIPLEVRS